MDPEARLLHWRARAALSRVTLRLEWRARAALSRVWPGLRPLSRSRQSCFLCTVWRSGSAFLGDAVCAAGDLDLAQERLYLNTQRASLGAVLRGRSFLLYLDRLIERGTNRHGIFGTKVMWVDLRVVLRRLREIPDFRRLSELDALRAVFPEPVFLFLTRTDKLRQAISFYRARASHVWHRDDGGHLYVTPGPARAEPEYDYVRIQNALERITNAEQAWREFFRSNAIEPLEMTYEEVCASLPTVVGRVLERLGHDVPAGRLSRVRSKYVRLADAKTEAWVQRFRHDSGQNR